MEEGHIGDRHLDTSDALDEFINSSSNTMENNTVDNPPIAIVSDEVSGSNLSSHNPKEFLEGVLHNPKEVHICLLFSKTNGNLMLREVCHESGKIH